MFMYGARRAHTHPPQPVHVPPNTATIHTNCRRCCLQGMPVKRSNPIALHAPIAPECIVGGTIAQCHHPILPLTPLRHRATAVAGGPIALHPRHSVRGSRRGGVCFAFGCLFGA
eukprot:364842-Chlamydomonas_euryale.AAC.1